MTTLKELVEESYPYDDADWILCLMDKKKFSLEHLLAIGYPVKALYETIKLCEYGMKRHGANTWKSKYPEYHREHYENHDKDNMALEDESNYISRFHCALREMMFTEAMVFGNDTDKSKEEE